MLVIPKKFKMIKFVSNVLSFVGIAVSLFTNRFFANHLIIGFAAANLIEIAGVLMFFIAFCSLLPLKYDTEDIKISHAVKEFSVGMDNLMFTAGFTFFAPFISSVMVNGMPLGTVGTDVFFSIGAASGAIFALFGLYFRNVFISLLIKKKKLHEIECPVSDNKLIRIITSIVTLTIVMQNFLNVYGVISERANTVYFPMLVFFEGFFIFLIHENSLGDYSCLKENNDEK